MVASFVYSKYFEFYSMPSNVPSTKDTAGYGPSSQGESGRETSRYTGAPGAVHTQEGKRQEWSGEAP